MAKRDIRSTLRGAAESYINEEPPRQQPVAPQAPEEIPKRPQAAEGDRLVTIPKRPEKRTERKQLVLPKTLCKEAEKKARTLGVSLNEAVIQLLHRWIAEE